MRSRFIPTNSQRETDIKRLEPPVGIAAGNRRLSILSLSAFNRHVPTYSKSRGDHVPRKRTASGTFLESREVSTLVTYRLHEEASP
jgi:hypothetical protein